MSVTFSRRALLQLAAVSAAARHIPATQARVSVADSWDDADALTMGHWVNSGTASAQELLDEAIRRLDQVNPKLNLLAQDHTERARKELADYQPKGPFAGVPFLLKDLSVELKGTVTSGGSALMKNVVATQDSTMVRRFRNAGVIVFGKTNTPEFGMALTTEGAHLGDCKNPWNLAHSTGGSSGGSAAAVAAGIIPMAHATDGGGSIRVPANHCGVFGFKPTRGLTPGGSGAGMSVGHVVTRSVRDSAVMLEAISGYEPGAPYGVGLATSGFFAATLTPCKPLRVALNLTEPAVDIHPDVARAVRDTASMLQAMGHHVEEAAPGIDYDQLNQTQNVLMVSSMTAWLDYVEQTRGRPILEQELEPMTHMIKREGSGLTGSSVAAALEHMHYLGRQMGQFQQRYDLVLQPVTATPAPELGTITYRDGDDLQRYTQRFKRVAAFTHLYNMTGQPSVSLPLGMSESGLPIGVMLSAPVGADALLFSIASDVERAVGGFNQRPPVHAG